MAPVIETFRAGGHPSWVSRLRSWVSRERAASASPRGTLLVIVAAAILSHATALTAGFIWLDHAHIEGGLALVPLGDLMALFQHGFAGTGYYRPLMSLSLSLDAALGGSPLLFHATTLAWHAAAAAMVLIAGRALGVGERPAALAALLFAVHPATSLVADAIAFRSEAMMTVALLALVVFHLRGKALPAAGALLAGALTKETALLLGPLFIAALTVRPGPGAAVAPAGPAVAAVTRRRVLLAEASALLVALGLRLAFAPPWRATFPPLSFSERVGTRLAVLTRALWLFVAPLDLSVCDAFPVTSAWAWPALIGGALALALAAIASARRASFPVPLLLALSILPALHGVPISRWWSPHYFYLPLALTCLAIAEIVMRSRRSMVFIAIPILVSCAVLSLAEGRRYRSDEPFWTVELAAHPECREARFFLAETDREQARWEAAAGHYEAALTPTPGVLSYVDTRAALQNLGATRLAEGRFAEAELAFGSARELAVDPRARRELTHDMAAAALAGGHAQAALDLLEPELTRADAFPQSLALGARSLHALGRDAEAAAVSQRLLRGAPFPPYPP